MGAPNLVSIDDFMARLEDEGYVLVKGSELYLLKEMKLAALQKKYMKRTSLTFKEILEAELLPVATKKGIESWIDRGKIKDTEVVPGDVRRILTAAIRRLGYDD